MISALNRQPIQGSDGRHPRRQGKGDGTTEEGTSLADTPDSATQAAWVTEEISWSWPWGIRNKFAKDMANLD